MNIILCKYGILFPMGDIYSFFIICLIIFEAKNRNLTISVTLSPAETEFPAAGVVETAYPGSVDRKSVV